MLFRSDVIYLMDLSAISQDSNCFFFSFDRSSASFGYASEKLHECLLHDDHVISSFDLHKIFFIADYFGADELNKKAWTATA